MPATLPSAKGPVHVTPGTALGYDMPMITRRTQGSRGIGSAATGVLLAAASATAAAHHSIAAVYDGTRQQRVEGVVAEFQFINPHPFVIVDVGAGERTERWRLEMDNRFELAGIGMTSETLLPGDRVVATGSLGRVEPRTLYLRQLDRPADGFRYEQVGSRPRVNTAGR